MNGCYGMFGPYMTNPYMTCYPGMVSPFMCGPNMNYPFMGGMQPGCTQMDILNLVQELHQMITEIYQTEYPEG